MFFDNKLSTVEQYLRRLSGQEKEPVVVDHNYVKPWSAHPESQRTKPAKMLFMNTVYRKKGVVHPDEEIDVVGVDPPTPSPFDSHKSKVLANELERSLRCNPNIDVNRPEISFSHTKLSRWSYQQKRMYKLVMKIINAESLAKIVYTGQPHESLKRKVATEKFARQLRTILGNACWDFELIVWIHKLILDHCSFLTVVSYLSLLQALRTKVPNFVDKVIRAYSGRLGHDFLSSLLKKHSDPVLPILNQYKIKKLPGNPFLLISSAGFDFDRAVSESPRFRFWTTQLNALCKTMHVPVNSDDIDTPLETLEDLLEVAILSLKNKVTEFKNHFPNRPVILAGWTVGALIACHVALEMPVDAVICFGFPLTGVNGSRGELDDPLLEIKVPVLFIVGENASMCSIDDVEDFRSRMRAETSLVVIGSSDDYLLISPQKMQQDSVTQAMVDRSILDEISDFLQSSLVKMPSTSSHLIFNSTTSCPTIIEESAEVAEVEEGGKRKRRRPKEYSPELPSSRKRTKHSITKEVPSVPSKSRLSPSSSETSSSGSSKYEKQTLAKTAKKQPEKRGVGRPPSSGTGRKRTTPKPIIKSVPEVPKIDTPTKRAPKRKSPPPVIKSPPKKPLVMETKSSIPFALNILPKKNDPVDVEKAFGKDSSFLPRPLTPPEPEDTVSAEETEKAMAELDALSLLPAGLIPSPTSDLVNGLPEITAASEKTFMPLTEQSPVTVLGTKTLPASIIKPILNTATETKKGITVSVAPSGFKTVFQQGKVLNPISAAQLKNISGVNLLGGSLSQCNGISSNKAMIAVPSNSATILVSSSALKAQPGKVLQLLSKGPISLKAKDPAVATVNGESSEQQVCNLSLLSDVAGMTEPLKDTSRKIEVNGVNGLNGPSATLVKLAVPDKSQQLKRFQVLKSLQTRAAPTRVETAEEVVEKQLAIQALNKSIGIECSNSHVKESGYSICYAKPDGSIVSRAIPRPGQATYIRQSIIPHLSGRGRVRPILPNKMYRFCHK